MDRHESTLKDHNQELEQVERSAGSLHLVLYNFPELDNSQLEEGKSLAGREYMQVCSASAGWDAEDAADAATVTAVRLGRPHSNKHRPWHPAFTDHNAKHGILKFAKELRTTGS